MLGVNLYGSLQLGVHIHIGYKKLNLCHLPIPNR